MRIGVYSMSINDFETWDDYVRYREINGYTEHELDCMYEMEQEDIEYGYDELN
jgi:hypothetical protein